MKCQPCGQDNAATALFCTACRRPLVAPSKLPTRIEPLAVPAMAAAAPAMAPAYGAAAETPSSRNRFAPPNAGTHGRSGDGSAVLTEEDAWAAIVGDANTTYYLDRFDGIRHGDSGGWHWPGFLVTWYWMLYRKMWTAAAIWFFAPYVYLIALAAVFSRTPAVVGVGVLIGWVVHLLLPGIMANKWYYNQCMRRIAAARRRGGSNEQMLARMEAAGGTSNILVIVLAFFGISFIVGILAAVSLPAYQTYGFKAKMAEAIPVANDVAAAVGGQYVQTGQLPAQSDVDRMVAQAAHQSKYVTGVDIESTTGELEVHVALSPQVSGTLKMSPASDNDRHLSWTCSTDDLQRYVPASCRPDGASR